MSLNLEKSAWESIRFGDVVQNVKETVRDAAAVGIQRVIGLEHLDPGELEIARYGDDPSSTTFTKRVSPGQTLFGKRRAYLRKAAYADLDAITSGDILTFEAVPTRLLPELLPFLVQSDRFFANAVETSAGSLSPRTNWRDLAKFEFALPPISDQRRLADLLWTAEHHRRALREERRRLVRAANISLADQLGPGEHSLLDFADALVGYAFESSNFQEASSDDSRPLLRGINIGVGRTRWETADTVYWAKPLTPRTEKQILFDGDIVVPMDRPFTADGRLRWAEIDTAHEGALLVQRVMRLRPHRAEVRPIVRAIVRSPPFQLALSGSLTGSFAPHLAHGDFARFSFGLEQPHRAAHTLESVERADHAIEREQVANDNLRDLLLREVF